MRMPGPAGLIMRYRRGGNGGPEYDVAPGDRHLMLRNPGLQLATEIVLVQHWFEELRRLAPTR